MQKVGHRLGWKSGYLKMLEKAYPNKIKVITYKDLNKAMKKHKQPTTKKTIAILEITVEETKND